MALRVSICCVCPPRFFSRALNYCRIFTEISEALLHRMLELSRNNNGTHSAANLFHLLDLVLVCVGHHDYEVPYVAIRFYDCLLYYSTISRRIVWQLNEFLILVVFPAPPR